RCAAATARVTLDFTSSSRSPANGICLAAPPQQFGGTPLLRRQSMFGQINLGLAPCLVAATLFAWGCDRPATPAGPKPSFSDGTASCAAGARFTGGGRIDPPVAEKTTFGFNLDASDFCASGGGAAIKGQLQTMNHPTKTLIHSLTIDDFFSFDDPEGRGGRCAAFSGTARVK